MYRKCAKNLILTTLVPGTINAVIPAPEAAIPVLPPHPARNMETASKTAVVFVYLILSPS